MATARLALVPYVADTEVVEVIEPSEEPEMQVRIIDDDGVMRWHRWLAGSNGSQAACGDPVNDKYTHGTRYAVCEGDLCPECFTPLEIVKAAMAKLASRRRNS